MSKTTRRAITSLIAAATSIALTLQPTLASPSPTPTRVLVYGDSNTWGWVPTESGFPTTRFSKAERYPGVMQAELGSGFEILENGLNNRTTNLDYPEPIGILAGSAFNGARTLPGLLAAHAPLDLVVIMLGSNDLRDPFWRTADESAAAIAQLIDIVKSSNGSVANTYAAPQILIVAPPRIGSMPHPYIAERFSGAEQVSKGFAEAYRAVAEEAEVPFLDATEAIGITNGWDGIHISAEQHQQLGSAIAAKIRTSYQFPNVRVQPLIHAWARGLG